MSTLDPVALFFVDFYLKTTLLSILDFIYIIYIYIIYIYIRFLKTLQNMFISAQFWFCTLPNLAFLIREKDKRMLLDLCNVSPVSMETV